MDRAASADLGGSSDHCVESERRRTEAEQVSMLTAIAHGLVGPKPRGNPSLESSTWSAGRGDSSCRLGENGRKGIRPKFRNQVSWGTRGCEAVDDDGPQGERAQHEFSFHVDVAVALRSVQLAGRFGTHRKTGASFVSVGALFVLKKDLSEIHLPARERREFPS